MSDNDGGDNSLAPGNEKEGNNIPLHKLLEEKERRKVAEKEAELLKAMLEQMRQQVVQKEQPITDDALEKEISVLDDESKKGVQALVERALIKERKGFNLTLGMLLEKTDLMEFKAVAGKDYDKYSRQVQVERQEALRRGMMPPDSATIYKTLKAQEMSKRYEEIIANANKNGGKIEQKDMEAMHETDAEAFARTMNGRVPNNMSNVFNSFNMGGMSRGMTSSKKDFKSMTTEEKEKALENIKL